MFAAVLTFIKSKIFSTSGIFILIFAAIIATLVLSNTDTILSKFGFETASTLKADLAKANEQLKEAKRVNDNLVNTIETITKEKEATVKALEEVQVNLENTTKIVATANKKIETLSKKPVETLKKKTTKTVKVIENAKVEYVKMPVAEVNELSTININALGETYAELFGETSQGAGENQDGGKSPSRSSSSVGLYDTDSTPGMFQYV